MLILAAANENVYNLTNRRGKSHRIHGMGLIGLSASRSNPPFLIWGRGSMGMPRSARTSRPPLD